MREFEKGFTLPFKADRFGEYIFDANGEMVAMTQTENPMILLLIADRLNDKNKITHNVLQYDKHTSIISSSGVPLLMIRGWGHLTGIGGLNLSDNEALAIQDDLADYIIEKLTK